MDEMSRLGARLLSWAVVVWTGWGRTSWPLRDEAALEDVFGSELARDLMTLIRDLEAEFYESDARFVASSPRELGDLAAARFRSRRPELPEELVQALSWCYTYDYK